MGLPVGWRRLFVVWSFSACVAGPFTFTEIIHWLASDKIHEWQGNIARFLTQICADFTQIAADFFCCSICAVALVKKSAQIISKICGNLRQKAPMENLA